LETLAVRASRWLGSLQVAVLLLSLFAVVLVVGTIVESWYDGKIAQQLVYKTWWFTGLLVVLGVNIFFAAVKKCDFSGWSAPAPPGQSGVLDTISRLWPWKKHQTGFLITHVGLLTLVSGGILNSLGGTDAMMATVDTDNPRFAGAGSHSTSSIFDRDISLIRIRLPHHPEKDKVYTFPFQPGPTCWKADEYLQPKLDTLAGILNVLAHPLPRTWETDLNNGARLEVLNYYPTVRQEPFGPARSGDQGFPAIKFELFNPRFGRDQQWIAYHNDEDRIYRPGGPRGPAMVEFLARDCPSELIREFQSPPAPDEVGAKGQLVLFLGGEKFSFDVNKHLDVATSPLGNSGWSLRIQEYLADIKEKNETPANPAILLELLGPQGQKARLAADAHRPAEVMGTLPDKLKNLRIWYHPPDYRYSETSVRGLLQFVTDQDGKIHFRTFNSSKGSFALEKAGTTGKGQKRLSIWQAMDFQFRITEYLPNAGQEPVPEDRRLGLEDEMNTPPAIRCRLTYKNNSKDFWVTKSDSKFTNVTVENEPFAIGFNSYIRKLDFEITLLRAEQTSDPGTGQAATYSSFVELTDKRANVFAEPRVITMNQPLDWDGYKLYQSGYTALGMDPDTNRPVNQSVFTVARDPGLWLKYAGSTMLALGIACMFYMKAYFFKPRGRARLATNTLSNGQAGKEN
jgi:hypothetical protein